MLKKWLEKAFIFELLIQIALPASASANISDPCPLSNPAYQDLRSAAVALEQEILFPAGCEDLAKKFKEANEQISTSAQGLSDLDSNNSTDLTKGQRLANLASEGILQIGHLFQAYGKTSDQCGKALLSAKDYLIAFIDTINGMTPMLMIFGGAASIPTTLGVTILGASIKTFAIYFSSLEQDMSTTQARQAFISNTCGYYRYNEILRSFIQNLKGQTSDFDQKVLRQKKELDSLLDEAPPKPRIAPEIELMEKQFQEDQNFFANFSAMLERSASTPELSCLLIKNQINHSTHQREFPFSAIEKLEQLVKISTFEGRPSAHHENLVQTAQEINQPGRYDKDCEDPSKSMSRVRNWLVVMKEVLTATHLELSLPGRLDLSETPLGKSRKTWEEQYSIKLSELKTSELQKNFLHRLAERGAEIDLSELLDARDDIRRVLFGDGKDWAFFRLSHKKNPAEAWLEHKWRSAELQLREYRQTISIFRMSWLDKEITQFPSPHDQQFACGYAENLIFAWHTAFQDIESSRFFCSVFQQTINEAAHPYVTEYCLGSFDQIGVRKWPGKLALTDLEVFQLKREITQIKAWAKKAKCETPKEIPITTPIDSTLPIEVTTPHQ